MLNNVLLLDDDDITHFICENVVKSEHLAKDITMLNNGKEGIEYLQNILKSEDKKGPELILLDLNMPVMNGWDFLETFANELEDKFPETKVCILTSSLDPIDYVHSQDYHNVIGFLNKPLIKERIEELKSNDQLAAYF
jgi:CheY-like chemotaxis protein